MSGLGEISNLAKKQGAFVYYLPQDEAVASGFGVEDGGLDVSESQIVVDLLNKELSRLLKLSPKDFWKEVASNNSLHTFLDSFLQYRNRWYDFPHHGAKGTMAGVIVGEVELSRRVFMILYRMSSNRDHGARASYSLNAKEHEALLQEKRLLDLPKLLDICAIYGHDNEELTRLLVNNAMKAQPRLAENLRVVMVHFANIVQTLHQRCISSLEAVLAPRDREDLLKSQIPTDLLEVADFINDGVMSVDAFIAFYEPASLYLCCPLELSYGTEEVLQILARLHDSLLPSLQSGVTQVSSGKKLQEISLNFEVLRLRIVNLGWKLFDFCYLSKNLLENDLSITVTKMFPATVEDPAVRGDILVQTFGEINALVSSHSLGCQTRQTFLQSIEKRGRILSRIDRLRSEGWIFLDDEQFQYLTLILTPSEAIDKDLEFNSRSKNMQMDEEAIIMESNISQIKDLLPDYGKGFISACLEVYNHNPEEVIQRILEGTLHEELVRLDITLEKAPPSKLTSVGHNDKGKGQLIESSLPYKENIPTNDRETDGQSPSSLHGRFTRKLRVELSDSEIFDSRDEKDSIKTALLASQYEYEDEYDDSFDELGFSVADSTSEVEGPSGRTNFSPGESQSLERNNYKESGSKWTQKKTQFYVKDGKNYSYKVSGAIAVSDANEAALVNQAQKELIHGLGRGGNIPLGAVKKLMDAQGDKGNSGDIAESGDGNPNSRGNVRGRGRGRGGRHHQKDRAARKHFAGLTGY